jgi:multimeric flavodoxin WrbA
MLAGISSSPKKEKSNTRFLLEKALEAASEELSDSSAETPNTTILDLHEFEILPCTGCDSCVRKKPCPQSAKDDMTKIEEKLKDADGIIISAPSYFTSVPGILKNLMDRSRPMKMQDHELKDKLFGAITYAGLRYGGQEHVIDLLNRYALAHGMIVIGGLGSPVKHGTFGSGSMQKDDGGWRSAREDELAISNSEAIGKRMAVLIKSIKRSK